MSKESAKKLISELQTNEELKAKIAGITDPAELTKKAEKTDEKLSLDDLDAVAGGYMWKGEDAPDGHELGCALSYHQHDYQIENNIWCNRFSYCNSNYQEQKHCKDMDKKQ